MRFVDFISKEAKVGLNVYSGHKAYTFLKKYGYDAVDYMEFCETKGMLGYMNYTSLKLYVKAKKAELAAALSKIA